LRSVVILVGISADLSPVFERLHGPPRHVVWEEDTSRAL
jgi:hypothetical protein